MAMTIGPVVVGLKKSGPGRPANGQVLVKTGTRKTGNRGGADKRTKG
jgi:hypothetical protein